MPSIEARLKAANAGSTTRTDRKSADAIFLSTANLTSELSRVNSTPLSSEAIDALTLKPSTSSTTDGSPNEPSPLTMAPPKPGPADTLYPSPSGGFVPSPEEGQDWRLKPPPPGRRGNTAAANSSPSAAAGSSSSASASASTASPPTKLRTLSSVAHVNNQRPTSCLGLTATCSTSTPARPPSLPCSNETAARIASASSSSLSRRNSQASNSLTSPQLRPTSSSASSRHRLSNASASAVAAAEGNTDVASQHNQEASRADLKSSRPTSSASYQTARNAEKPQDSPYAIEVRDFAFPPDDPRHHGEQLLDPEQEEAEQGSQDHYPQEESDAAEHEFYIEGADDENEFDGDEGDNANVPEGVYKVLYEFDPVSEHELAVQPGETVHVVGSIEGGWAIAIKDDDQAVKGLVPATYLECTGPLPE